MDLETALDELFAEPIEGFTAKRNALAKELKGADAAAVKATKKPNLAAWAANQVARRHADDLAQLFDVTDKLRRAQRKVLSGGKAAELRQATDERNKMVSRLTKLAENVLRDAGHGASAATLSGVADSFMAVASDPEGAERLRKGRLERELEPSAVIDVGGLTLVEEPEEEGPGEGRERPERRKTDRGEATKLLEARRIVSELRGVVKGARASFKEADREAERLLRRAEEADRVAKAAHEEAGFARRAADARRGDAEEAERRLEAAQAALKDLESG